MSVKILWASQTGNCEEISLRIAKDCTSRNIPNIRYCLQELGSTLTLQNSEVLVFVVSSTGDGELPDNGLKFFKWIRAQDGQILSGIRFAILGLGDSNYSTYQGGPKTIEKQMKRLGAKEFYLRGEADEQMGLENAIEPWIDGLWDLLKFELARPSLPTASIDIKAEDMVIIESVITRKRVLSERNTSKQIIELQLSIDQPYIPGTAILMYPQNNRDKVEKILQYAGLDKAAIVSLGLVPKSITHRCRAEVTLLEYFVQFVDILSPLKSRTALYLSQHLRDPDEKLDFETYIDPDKLVMPAAYTLECILSQYQSWHNFQIAELLEQLPVLSGRNYSISSSPNNSPNHITIVFTVTGLCTRYLNSITDFAHRLHFSLPLSKGSFWEGVDSASRLLIIATGTGISPFKGILEHLSHSPSGHKPVWVIYGCRNSVRSTIENNFDHIYFEEISQLVRPLGKLSVANSRSPVGPKHVQEILEEQADEIYDWTETALLCGSFKSKEIHQKLQEINPSFKIFTEEWD